MPGRPKKNRFIRHKPEVLYFKPQGVPLGSLQGVILSAEGLESMRLVDAEGLSQEEAAKQMGVSRPTLCRELNLARAQVARALSRGWAIRLDGFAAEDEEKSGNGSGCRRGQLCKPGAQGDETASSKEETWPGTMADQDVADPGKA